MFNTVVPSEVERSRGIYKESFTYRFLGYALAPLGMTKI